MLPEAGDKAPPDGTRQAPLTLQGPGGQLVTPLPAGSPAVRHTQAADAGRPGSDPPESLFGKSVAIKCKRKSTGIHGEVSDHRGGVTVPGISQATGSCSEHHGKGQHLHSPGSPSCRAGVRGGEMQSCSPRGELPGQCWVQSPHSQPWGHFWGTCPLPVEPLPKPPCLTLGSSQMPLSPNLRLTKLGWGPAMPKYSGMVRGHSGWPVNRDLTDKERVAVSRPGNAELGPKAAGQRPGQGQPGEAAGLGAAASSWGFGSGGTWVSRLLPCLCV